MSCFPIPTGISPFRCWNVTLSVHSTPIFAVAMAPYPHPIGVRHPSSSADFASRQAAGSKNTTDDNPIDWDEVLNEMRNSSSPAFGGPPPPRYDPPNFGCFTCVTRDNDARLTYKGSWSLNGTPTATMHSSTERGASVAFRFNGSGIIVMGTVPRSNGSCKPPTATYILDASKPVVTTAPTASSDIPNQPLFFANGLSADEHELTIEVGGFGRPAPYIVQQFFVFPKFNVTQHVVDTLPTSSLKGPTRPTTSIISPTNVTSSLPNTPSNTISSSATIRVLAGTLGSLVVLIVLVVLFFIFRRRHQHHRTAPPKVHKTDKRSSFASSTRGLQEGTFLTSTESILRNNPSGIFSLYTRSEQGRGSVVDYYLSLSAPSSEPPVPSRQSLLVPPARHRQSLPQPSVPMCESLPAPCPPLPQSLPPTPSSPRIRPNHSLLP